MRERLLGPRSRTPVPGIATSPDRHWQRVPKINILPRRGRTTGGALMVRGLLALIVVLEVFWVQQQYRAKVATEEATRATKATLERAQQQLAAEQGSVGAIQSQLSQLQQQRDAKQQAYKEATVGRIDWSAAIATLLAVESPTVTFESVTVQEGAKVVVKGIASEAEAMATLPSRLRGTSAVLDFQSIRWEAENPGTRGSPPPTGGPILKFTAIFAVRR